MAFGHGPGVFGRLAVLDYTYITYIWRLGRKAFFDIDAIYRNCFWLVPLMEAMAEVRKRLDLRTVAVFPGEKLVFEHEAGLALR